MKRSETLRRQVAELKDERSALLRRILDDNGGDAAAAVRHEDVQPLDDRIRSLIFEAIALEQEGH